MSGRNKKEPESVLDSMNPELKAVREQIVSEVVTHSARNLEFYWRMGKRLEAVRSNPAKFGGSLKVAGKALSPIDALAVSIGRSGSQIVYKSLRFVEIYPNEKELQRICSIRVNERPLTWSHVILLCTIADPVEREEIEQRIVAEGIDDASDLHQILQEARGRQGAGGRPLSVPKNLNAAISQVAKQSRLFGDKLKSVWFGDKYNILKKLNSDLDDVDEEMLDTLFALSNAQKALAASLEDNADKLQAKVKQLELKFEAKKRPVKVSR